MNSAIIDPAIAFGTTDENDTAITHQPTATTTTRKRGRPPKNPDSNDIKRNP